MTASTPPDDGGKKTGKKRGPRGRFTKGNAGGPGRPKGSRNKTTLLIEGLLEGDAEKLTRALIRKAKLGHGVALQIVFDRLAPPRRDRHVEIDLPPIQTAADLSAASLAVIRAVAGGMLTPSEGQQLSGLLESRRKVLDAVDVEARLAALEKRAALPK